MKRLGGELAAHLLLFGPERDEAQTALARTLRLHRATSLGEGQAILQALCRGMA